MTMLWDAFFGGGANKDYSYILSVAETVNGVTKNTAYTYDKLNRIASVIGDKGADSYYEYGYRGIIVC